MTECSAAEPSDMAVMPPPPYSFSSPVKTRKSTSFVNLPRKFIIMMSMKYLSNQARLSLSQTCNAMQKIIVDTTFTFVFADPYPPKRHIEDIDKWQRCQTASDNFDEDLRSRIDANDRLLLPNNGHAVHMRLGDAIRFHERWAQQLIHIDRSGNKNLVTYSTLNVRMCARDPTELKLHYERERYQIEQYKRAQYQREQAIRQRQAHGIYDEEVEHAKACLQLSAIYGVIVKCMFGDD